MTITNCSKININHEHKFLPSVYLVVFAIGLVANGWGLRTLPQKWKKLGNINVFVLNLGLANLLYLPTLPFLVVYYYLKSKWIFGAWFCKVTRFCFNLNLYGTIGFLTCISVYRYLAIVHPMRVLGRISVTHSVIISALVWLMVGVQSLPDMFFPRTLKKKCYHTTNAVHVEDYLRYSLGWTLTGFCIPLLITLVCYGHVIFVLVCRKNTIDKALRQRSLRFLFILILLFSVCYIPYHVLKNLTLTTRVLSKQKICPRWSNAAYLAHQISRGLVCLNSALNPLVYLHGRDDIPAGLRRILQRAHEMFFRSPSNHDSVPVPLRVCSRL